MTRWETLLVSQFITVGALAFGLIWYFSCRTRPERAEPTVVVFGAGLLDEPVDAGEAGVGEEGVWVPLERMDYILGPWVTETRDLLVSVAASGTPEAYGLTSQPWRLSVEWGGHPFIVCGVYSRLEYDGSQEAWRLGYCTGVDKNPEVVRQAHVGLFRARGREQIRLKLEGYFDVELFQAP